MTADHWIEGAHGMRRDGLLLFRHWDRMVLDLAHAMRPYGRCFDWYRFGIGVVGAHGMRRDGAFSYCMEERGGQDARGPGGMVVPLDSCYSYSCNGCETVVGFRHPFRVGIGWVPGTQGLRPGLYSVTTSWWGLGHWVTHYLCFSWAGRPCHVDSWRVGGKRLWGLQGVGEM